MQDDPFARAVARTEAIEQARADAARRELHRRWSAGNRTAFQTHATVFAAVNVLLLAIWLTTWQLADGTSYPWFLWPLLGWAVGLAAHFAAVRHHLTRPAGAAPVTPSTTAELTRLSELHRAGSLSDEEFTAAKTALLQPR